MFLQSLEQKVHQEIGIVEPNSEDDSPNEKSYLQLYYGVVIGPIEDRLHGKDLIIVPDGPL